MGEESTPTAVAPTVAAGPLGASLSGAPGLEGLNELLGPGGFAARYGDRRNLGKGGMGEVDARADKLIGRDVAMKVIHARFETDPDLVRRFLRESRVQGQLEHPSIVPVYELGLTPEGRAYFTMKRVQGRTLAAIVAGLRDGDAEIAAKYTSRRLLTAFSAICLAVDFAHARGVIHRDLKPANIMLGEFGEVYVLDWGVARIVGVPDAEHAPIVADETGATDVGAVIGTPGYMAPEQARGELEIDARADVYALGAILSELLAVTPDPPPELDALRAAALAHAPKDRIASARILSDRVEGFLDGDRDLARRRAQAEVHAEAATRLMDDQVSGGVLDRPRALREVGRALGLDPANARARRAMLTLLTTPPRKLPPEASAALDASALERQRVGAWMGVFSFVAWCLALPIGWWMGIADVRLFAVFGAAQLAALAACLNLARAPRVGGAPTVLAAITVMTASATLILGFGSLVLVPVVVAATMATGLLHPRPPGATAIIVGSLLTVLVPVLLEVAGAISPSYRFDAGVMEIHPRMLYLPKTATLFAITIASLTTIATLAIAVTRVRRAYASLEEQLQLTAWQLRQLVAAQD